MSDKKIKKVAISFSGGMDSVSLAIDNLEKGNNVELLRFEISNNWAKSILERKACTDIVKELEKKYPNKHISLTHCGNVELLNVSLTLPQAVIWAFMLGSSSFYSVDEVQVGYILNDCAVSYMDEIKKLYSSFQAFKDQKLPPLKFPYIKKHKSEIYRNLPYDIRKMTVTCEQPIIENVTSEQYAIFKEKRDWSFLDTLEAKECGHCETCTKKKNAFGEETLFNSLKSEQKSVEDLTPAVVPKEEAFEEVIAPEVEPVETELVKEENYKEILAS